MTGACQILAGITCCSRHSATKLQYAITLARSHVRRQGDLHVCLQLGRMQSDYARIPMSPPPPYICTREPAGGLDANKGETGRNNVDFEY